LLPAWVAQYQSQIGLKMTRTTNKEPTTTGAVDYHNDPYTLQLMSYTSKHLLSYCCKASPNFLLNQSHDGDDLQQVVINLHPPNTHHFIEGESAK